MYDVKVLSFVYFDVGGVVIKDFTANDKWSELEREIGVAVRDSQAFMDFWEGHEEEICRGRDTEEIFSEAKEKFNLQIPENYSILEGFAKRFEANETIWPVIEKIKKDRRIGLLTNMYPGMLDLIHGKGIMPKVTWGITIDSSLEGVAKPDAKIFEIAQKRAGVDGREILFVENSKRHVEAAKKFGWQTFFYDSADPQGSSKRLLDLF